MKCAEIKELLSAYIDAMLEPAEKQAVETHCATCPECRKELAELTSVVSHIASLKPIDAPVDFTQKVHERIERRSEFERIMKKIFTPRMKLPLEVAGMLTSVVLVITVYRFMHPMEKAYYSPMTEQVLEVTAPIPISKNTLRNTDDSTQGFKNVRQRILSEQKPLNISRFSQEGVKKDTLSFKEEAYVGEKEKTQGKGVSRGMRDEYKGMNAAATVYGDSVGGIAPQDSAGNLAFSRAPEQHRWVTEGNGAMSKAADIQLVKYKTQLYVILLPVKSEIIQTNVIPLIHVIAHKTTAQITNTTTDSRGITTFFLNVPTNTIQEFMQKIKFIAPKIPLPAPSLTQSESISIQIVINPL